MDGRRRGLVASAAVALLAVAGCSGEGAVSAAPSPLPPDPAPSQPAAPVHVTVASSSEHRSAHERAAARYEAAHPGVTVSFVDSRDLAEQRERFAAQLLTAMTDEVDVYEVDVAWAARFAGHAADVGDLVDDDRLAGLDSATVDALTVDGGLVAVPSSRPRRALLVSRYSSTPTVAADVALALAGLDPTDREQRR